VFDITYIFLAVCGSLPPVIRNPASSLLRPIIAVSVDAKNAPIGCSFGARRKSTPPFGTVLIEFTDEQVATFDDVREDKFENSVESDYDTEHRLDTRAHRD
jgi:hypothetical protein